MRTTTTLARRNLVKAGMTTFRNFAAMAGFCLTILVTTFQVQDAYSQNIDQLTRTRSTEFPANFLKMDRSGPLSIPVGCQDYIFEFSQVTPLSYVKVDVSDSFARDYSALAGSNEFSMNFNDIILDYANTVLVAKPARIGILELKENPGGAFHLVVDRGKTTLCIPMGYETGEEELSKLVRLVRTKDGQLAAMVTFNDTERILASSYPGIRERICMVLPLQESDPTKSLKLVRDREGNSFALFLLRDGNSRVKPTGSGKANLSVTLLTPSDKAMAEKMEMTLVVVN